MSTEPTPTPNTEPTTPTSITPAMRLRRERETRERMAERLYPHISKAEAQRICLHRRDVQPRLRRDGTPSTHRSGSIAEE